jgi:hypothetical protein
VAAAIANAPTTKRPRIRHPHFFTGVRSHNAALEPLGSDRMQKTETTMRVGMMNLIAGLPMARNSSGRTMNKTNIVIANFNELIMLNHRIGPGYFATASIVGQMNSSICTN